MQRWQRQAEIIVRMANIGLRQRRELGREVDQAGAGCHQAQRTAERRVGLRRWPQRAQLGFGTARFSDLKQGKRAQALRRRGDRVDICLRQRVPIRADTRVHP